MSQELNIIIQAKNEANRALKQVKGDLNGLNNEAEKGNKSLGKLSQVLGTGVKAAALGATTAIAGAGVALGGVINSSVRAAATMEEQVSGIAAVMGASASEVEQIENLILDLGINPNLKVSAEEAAQAIELLARNGVSLEEIQNGMAESTVLLANATNADFGTAADIATDAMASFSDTIKDGKDAVDGITSVTVNSKFSIDDYRLAMANAGAAVSEAGVSFDDFNTFLAGTASNFDSGSTAGTAFRNFITRLTPNTEVAADAMKELGLITEDGSNKFFDAEGNLKDMADVTELLKSSMSGLTEQQRQVALETIFGQDAMGAAVGAMNLGKEAFDDLKGTMGETDALESAKKRMDNFSGAMEILQGVFETIQLQIGNAFLPVLTEMAESLTTFVSENSDAIVSFFEKLAKGLENSIKFISDFVKGFSAEGDIFTKTISGFSEALDGLVPEKTIERIESFKESFNDFFSGLDQLIPEKLINNVKEFFGAFGDSSSDLTEFQTQIKALSDNHIQRFKESFSEASEGLGPLKDAFQELINAVGPLIQELSEVILPVLGAAINVVLNAFQAAIPAIVDVMTVLVTQITASVEAITGVISGLKDLVVGVLTGDFELASQGAQEIFNSLTVYFATTLDGIKQLFTIQFQAIGDFVKSIFEDISVFSEETTTAVSATWKNFTESTKMIIQLMVKSVESSIQLAVDAFNNVMSTVKTVTDAIELAWGSVTDALESGAQIVIDALELMGDAFNAVMDPINSLIKALEDLWGWLTKAWSFDLNIKFPSIPGIGSLFGSNSNTQGNLMTNSVQSSNVVSSSIPTGNSTIININGPTIRNDDDIKKLTDTIMNELVRRQRMNTA